MTDDDRPWEPPLAGSEAEHLFGAFDRLRATFRWKAGGLDAAGLAQRLEPSTLTLGGLLKHLAAMEDYYVTVKLTGAPIGGPWAGWGWDGSNDWEFASAADDQPEQLYALYDAAVERARAGYAAALERGGLDQLIAAGGGSGSLRRILFDMVEEYGRHTGQADLIRESIDGLVGEEPPPGWSPGGQ